MKRFRFEVSFSSLLKVMLDWEEGMDCNLISGLSVWVLFELSEGVGWQLRRRKNDIMRNCFIVSGKLANGVLHDGSQVRYFWLVIYAWD